MSRAILELCGVEDARPEAAENLLACLIRAANSRRPLEHVDVCLTAEVAFFERRVEAVDRFHGLGLHSFAAAIARRRTRRDELLLIAVTDDGPRLRAIPLGPVRIALAGMETRA